MALDLRHLRYFAAVADEGQMSRAAVRLNLAQPALSQAIASLERELGIQLLVRHSRGVRPTPAGRVLHAKAMAAIAAVEDAEVSIRAVARAERSRLIVGFPRESFEIVGGVIGTLRRRDPQFEVVARELDVRARLVELRAGRIDAEFLWPAADAEDLAVERLLASPRVALLWAGHPLASRTGIRFEEIASETFPGLHPDVPSEQAEFHLLTAERGRQPRVTREKPATVDETWSLIVNRRAISVCPEFLAAQYARAGVVAVRVVDVEPVAVGLAHRRGDDRPTVTALVAAARATAAELRRRTAYTSPNG
jgi:DNA-binding transcriptional LysR family regulator